MHSTVEPKVTVLDHSDARLNKLRSIKLESFICPVTFKRLKSSSDQFLDIKDLMVLFRLPAEYAKGLKDANRLNTISSSIMSIPWLCLEPSDHSTSLLENSYFDYLQNRKRAIRGDLATNPDSSSLPILDMRRRSQNMANRVSRIGGLSEGLDYFIKIRLSHPVSDKTYYELTYHSTMMVDQGSQTNANYYKFLDQLLITQDLHSFLPKQDVLLPDVTCMITLDVYMPQLSRHKHYSCLIYADGLEDDLGDRVSNIHIDNEISFVLLFKIVVVDDSNDQHREILNTFNTEDSEDGHPTRKLHLLSPTKGHLEFYMSEHEIVAREYSQIQQFYERQNLEQQGYLNGMQGNGRNNAAESNQYQTSNTTVNNTQHNYYFDADQSNSNGHHTRPASGFQEYRNQYGLNVQNGSYDMSTGAAAFRQDHDHSLAIKPVLLDGMGDKSWMGGKNWSGMGHLAQGPNQCHNKFSSGGSTPARHATVQPSVRAGTASSGVESQTASKGLHGTSKTAFTHTSASETSSKLKQDLKSKQNSNTSVSQQSEVIGTKWVSKPFTDGSSSPQYTLQWPSPQEGGMGQFRKTSDGNIFQGGPRTEGGFSSHNNFTNSSTSGHQEAEEAQESQDNEEEENGEVWEPDQVITQPEILLEDPKLFKKYVNSKSRNSVIHSLLACLKEDQYPKLLETLTPIIKDICKNKYGNYIVQVIARSLNSQYKEKFLHILKPHLVHVCCHPKGTFAIQGILSSMRELRHQSLFLSIVKKDLNKLLKNKDGSYIVKEMFKLFDPSLLPQITECFMIDFEKNISDKYAICILKEIAIRSSTDASKLRQLLLHYGGYLNEFKTNTFYHFGLQYFLEIFRDRKIESPELAAILIEFARNPKNILRSRSTSDTILMSLESPPTPAYRTALIELILRKPYLKNLGVFTSAPAFFKLLRDSLLPSEASRIDTLLAAVKQDRV